MLISVIVPVYKVEKYLSACVDSILAQTHKDLEIILVDDGSPDNCGAMCDEYARKDSRVRVIHKENGGLSDARNAGLVVCRGDYIGFVDSDDYIAPDMYERLAAFAEKEDLDVAACGFINVWPGHEERTPDFEPMVLTEPDEMIYEILENPKRINAIAVWCRIYRASRYKDLFFEKGRYMEDLYYILPCIARTHRFGILGERKYFYRHREGAITDAWWEQGKKIADLLEGAERNLAYIRKHYPRSIPVGEHALWSYYFVVICSLGGKDRGYCKELTQLIRKDIGKIWGNPYISLKMKLGFSFLAVNMDLFFQVRRVYHRLKGKR